MGFGKMFWGFLFMFDFRIHGLDIIPDIIGYILIYSALNQMLEESSHFQKAKKYALPLLIISIFDIYEIKTTVTGFSLQVFLFYIAAAAISIIGLVMIYYICSGIAEMSKKVEHFALEEKAMKRWKIYLYINVGIMVSTYLALFNPIIVAMILLPLVIGGIVSIVLLMGLMKEAERTFG